MKIQVDMELISILMQMENFKLSMEGITAMPGNFIRTKILARTDSQILIEMIWGVKNFRIKETYTEYYLIDKKNWEIVCISS